MFVYSKKIIQFIHEIKYLVKDILSTEIRMPVFGDRFYDRQRRYSYPIHVVIYNNKNMLGYFDSNFYELGFHECLMYSSKKQLHNVIRHELAHYITFITHGEAEAPHGNEFKGFCQLIGWGRDVYSATFCLESGEAHTSITENVILRKVQKLMALATSSNEHEAEQAMIKAQQFLLKHHIESKYLTSGKEEEEKIFLKRIMKQKKENAKMRSIAKILETFFVSPVYTRGGGSIYLEIVGNAVNIEIAEYVAAVLERELENLWGQVQRRTALKGVIAKNSFFLGLAKGYCNKVHALKREYNQEMIEGLMILEKQLVDAKAMVYPRLSKRHSSGSYCPRSSTLGEQMGRELNISPALSKGSSTASQKLVKLGD